MHSNRPTGHRQAGLHTGFCLWVAAVLSLTIVADADGDRGLILAGWRWWSHPGAIAFLESGAQALAPMLIGGGGLYRVDVCSVTPSFFL